MKKNFKLVLLLSTSLFLKINSQNITIPIAYSSVAANTTSTATLTKEQRDHFNGTTSDKIIVDLTGASAATLNVNGGATFTVSSAQHTVDISREIIAALDIKKSDQKIEIKDAIGTVFNVIIVKWDPFITERIAGAQSLINQKLYIDDIKNSVAFNNPYNNKKNRVNLFFDERGKLLNFLPVNVDANDYFYMYVVCPVRDENNYRVNAIEGEYAPVDLAIRPFTKPITIANSTEGGQEFEAVTYTITELRAGPFTSDNFKFQIVYDSTNGKVFNGPSYSMKVNKLHHVGVGLSIIRSTLSNPDFRVAPLSTGGNTIEQYNEGDRTMLTFNVMWYWSVLHQKPKGSVITSGRDILKDDPTFSFKRVFPTIGVTLDNKFNENFFAGAVYEFARGGSIIVGMHYGRVKELADKNFALSQDTFLGVDADIRTNKVYKPALFFGINIDTRIFNTLFGRGD